MINLRQIEVFRAVMETGSFTGAAQMLHVAQPGISRMIGHVEQLIGVKLFERGKGRIHPTPEAQVLHAEIERSYRGVKSVQECAAGLKFGISTMLRVVSSPNTGLRLVPAAISALAQKHSGAAFSLEVLQRATQMIDSLVSEQVDVAISSLLLEHPLLENRPVGQWHMSCVFPAGRALARRGSITPKNVQPYPLVTFEQNTLQGRLIGEWFARAKMEPKKSLEVRSGHVACAFVANGAGIAFVDNITAADSHPGILQHKPMSGTPNVKAYVVWNRNRPPSALAKELTRKVTEAFRGYARA